VGVQNAQIPLGLDGLPDCRSTLLDIRSDGDEPLLSLVEASEGCPRQGRGRWPQAAPSQCCPLLLKLSRICERLHSGLRQGLESLGLLSEF
jgi:hypothetical protein